MAVAFDAVSNPTQGGTGNLSWTHTPVGTPKAIIVHVVQNVNKTDDVTSVTYGGVTMTEVSGSPQLDAGATEPCAIYCYFLGASIPTGAQTVLVTVTTAVARAALAISLTAGADTEVVSTDASINTDASATPTISATLALSGRTCFVSEGFFSGVSTITNETPFTNWTSQQEFDFGSQVCGFYTYDIISTADVTIGWTTNAADDANCIAIAVSEIAAAAAKLVIDFTVPGVA